MSQKIIRTKSQTVNGFGMFAKGGSLTVVHTENCVVYINVSTKEQAEGNLSLGTQKKACEMHAP